ncbi:lipid-transfer protein [Pseudonocardia ailaonensis]|uniref:Lipid-transfer protein n=1 Tax=Pseudonocardia ailaonensis TaxID=367279 RepID=A0ABN2MIT1_9PSEU
MYVLGVGMSRFGGPPQTLAQKMITSGRAALADAGLGYDRVESLYLGSALMPPTFGVDVVKDFGLTGIPVVRIENASATGAAAFFEAVHAVAGGRVEVSMALGFDDPKAVGVGFNNRSAESRGLLGAVGPMTFFSMWAVRRMAERGTTIETLAKIAAKNWNNARHNPFAERQAPEPVTVEQVLASRMLAYPHTARMAAPQGGGAAAAIVVSGDVVRSLGVSDAVRVVAAQAVSERYDPGHLFKGAIVGPPEMARRGAHAAYEEAGIGPDELNVIAFHDAYAIEELLYYEEIGLCGPGEGDRLVHDGTTELTGKHPVSTDGGFIGRGHPAGPTGLAQIWELTEQLRGRAGGRQVADPRHGLAHIIGAGSVCYTHILEAAR